MSRILLYVAGERDEPSGAPCGHPWAPQGLHVRMPFAASHRGSEWARLKARADSSRCSRPRCLLEDIFESGVEVVFDVLERGFSLWALPRLGRSFGLGPFPL